MGDNEDAEQAPVESPNEVDFTILGDHEQGDDSDDETPHMSETEVQSVIRQVNREHRTPESVFRERQENKRSGADAEAPARPTVRERIDERRGIGEFFRRLFGKS